jgi:uncharacterized protein (DUF2141 family)
MNPNLPDTVTTSAVINAAQLLESAAKAETDSARRLMESAVAGFAREMDVSPDLLRPTSTVTVKSDSMGNFRFTDLSPGRYSISVSNEGFFAPTVAGYTAPNVSRIVRLDSTKTTLPPDIFMVQGGVISGHIQDSSGRPVVSARVQASQRAYPGGKLTLTLRTSETTDDRGNFRFAALLPGEYFLSVTTDINGLPTRDRALGITATAERGAAALTYYPGVADPWAAVPITVNDGAEVSGITIEITARLSDSQRPTFNISGFTVNNAPANQGNVIDRSINSFYLVPVVPNNIDDTPLEFQNMIPAESRPNGEFEIRNVPTGRYELYPFFRLGYLQPVRFRVHTSRNVVELRDANITNLRIAVNPGATLKAEVVATPPGDWLKFNVLNLGLRVIDSMPRTFAAVARQFDSSGRLSLENMPEARYALSLTGLPENAYVSDVRQNGRSIFDDGFLLEEQSNPVQILVNRDGGTVSGRVRTPRGSTQDVTVVLVPPLARRKNAALFKSATIDEDGSFIIRGIAPGAYTLFSLENRPAGEPWLNSDFMAKYEGRGRAIEVKAGSAIQLDSVDR